MSTTDNGIDRQAQLRELIEALNGLVSVLEQDSGCKWTGHFVRCLTQAESLRDDGYDQPALNRLSASLRSIFGGMGSFNDYAPARVDGEIGRASRILGMEAFDGAAAAVYDAAMKLVVIGQY
jgi:hypothetical protein